MYVDFNDLNNKARVWVYQSNEEFSEEQIQMMSNKLEVFINDWTRHGSQLKGSFQILYKRFVVIAVDEDFLSVSGCAIDASVRQIQQFESVFNIQLLDKMQVAVLNGEAVETLSMSHFRAKLNDGVYNKDSIVFNNLVDTKEGLLTAWKVPVSESWHQRLLKV